MNKKGQSIGMAIIIGIMIFFAGVYFINPIKTLIGAERVTMECSTPESISDGHKLTCLVLDGIIPYIIWAVISLAIGGILEKYIT